MTHPPRLIALCSSTMQSGKSEVAGRLVSRHGFRLVKFADPVKRMTEAFLKECHLGPGVIERMVEGDLKESLIDGAFTPRRIMQTLGTEWGRSLIDKNLWVNIAMARINGILAQDPEARVVIDDMRFPNEMDAVLDAGGVAFRVKRPMTQPYAAHESEGGLDNIQMSEFRNDWDLVNLYEQVDRWVDRTYNAPPSYMYGDIARG